MSSIIEKMKGLAHCKLHVTEKYLQPLALLWARFYIGRIFWKSGTNKLESLSDTTELFELEFIPAWEKNSVDIFGFDLSWTVPNAALAGQMTAYAEVAFPALLLLGLGTRFSAFALICMTLTIELFVYPGTTEHYHWMTILVLILTVGPGSLSLDKLIRKKLLSD